MKRSRSRGLRRPAVTCQGRSGKRQRHQRHRGRSRHRLLRLLLCCCPAQTTEEEATRGTAAGNTNYPVKNKENSSGRATTNGGFRKRQFKAPHKHIESLVTSQHNSASTSRSKAHVGTGDEQAADGGGGSAGSGIEARKSSVASPDGAVSAPGVFLLLLLLLLVPAVGSSSLSESLLISECLDGPRLSRMRRCWVSTTARQHLSA